MNFHDVRFPLTIALGAKGGPERRTDIVTLASGAEERNARWADSRRRWDAGTGVKSLADLAALTAFFEERRGRLYGFRWRDAADWRSCAPGAEISPLDQSLDGGFLAKRYGVAFAPYLRRIAKPVAGTVRMAIDGVETTAFTCDTATGAITLDVPPPPGAALTAGFAFDVPVRFDTDTLSIDLAAFGAGACPDVPVIEVRP